MHGLLLFVPVEVDVGIVRIGSDAARDFFGEAARLVGREAGHAQHDGIFVHRARLDVAEFRADVAKVIGECRAEFACELFTRGRVFCDDDELREVVSISFRRDGQHEARRRAADIIRIVVHFVDVLAEKVAHAVSGRLRRSDG